MKNKNVFILLFISVFLFFGCTKEKQEERKAKYVVFIGFDGWGSYSVDKADMPNVKKLMTEGSYTLRKRSVLPSSSAVNWATMFMGSNPELHGYTTWGSQKPELPSRIVSHYDMYPSIWGLVRDAWPDMKIGYIYEWDGMKYIAEMQAMSKEENTPNSAETAMAGIKYIKESMPEFVGIIFAEPDYVGHGAGHDTPEYYDMLKILDGYVGEIVQAVTEAGMLEDTIFILTSDHGGIDKGHGGKTMEEMETPFIISGKNIKKNYEIENSMMQFDVASTIAYIFNLEQPQVWTGRPVTEVFE